MKLRLRLWWRRHWWPARIRQLDQERAYWKRWCEEAEERATPAGDLLYEAWAVIANAHEGRWDEATPEWRAAAERWREKWHAHLDVKR